MLVRSKGIIPEVIMQIEDNYYIQKSLHNKVKYSFADEQRRTLWLDILHKFTEDGRSCLIFSFSISVREMVFRLFSVLTEISVEKLLLGMLNNNDWSRLTEIAGYLYAAPLWFSRTEALSEIESDLNDFDLVIAISSVIMTKKEFED